MAASLSAPLIGVDTPSEGFGGRLNWLRAGVLGANDGIVSTAGIVIGVAGATTEQSALVTAGVAGLIAGAVSMALGEYVSVSSQRDAERSVLTRLRVRLTMEPTRALASLAAIYEAKGLRPETARQVAAELTEHDALTAHAEATHNLDPDELTNPWHAAFASAVAFSLGALLPLLVIALTATGTRVPVTAAVVLVALAITGGLSARLGGAPAGRAVGRLVLGGALALAATYAVGTAIGAAV